MAERTRAVYYVLDSEGRPIPTATITLRQSGTSTNITETIYVNDDPDASQYTNGAFFSGADGKVIFYLTDPKRLDMLVTKSGYSSQTIPLDVQKSSLGVASVQDEGSDLTARSKVNFTGAGVTATDDAANGRTNVAISGGVTDHGALTGLSDDDHPQYILETLADAKGDLWVASAADTAARKAVGTDFQLLRARAAATDGIEWATLGSGASVATLESTTSTSFTDLATAGPAVTLTTGTSALVVVSADLWNSDTAKDVEMAFAVSGATTRAAAATEALKITMAAASQNIAASRMVTLTGLTAGSNTFTAKYRGPSAGTASFRDRHIIVIPL